MFWAWLLAGGSANYGGRWWVLHPYSQTGTRATPSPWPVIGGGEGAKPGQAVMHTQQLTGLDSVKAIRDFFAQRKIELSDFEPDQTLAKDADGAAGVRRGHRNSSSIIRTPPPMIATRARMNRRRRGWSWT